jgi:hypothetical protein
MSRKRPAPPPAGLEQKKTGPPCPVFFVFGIWNGLSRVAITLEMPRISE